MEMTMQDRQRQSNSGECPVCHGTGWEITLEILEGYREPLALAKRCSRCKGKRYINDQTGIPPEYCNADLSKFDFSVYRQNMGKMAKIFNDFVENFDRWEKQGKGLYLWSETPGSGKTFLSCCLARSLMVKYGLQMRFITAPDYIDVVGEKIKRTRGEADPSQIYRKCKVLVLDDLGAQVGNDWQKQEMFRLVNSRMEEGNITIFTSNFDANDLNVDARTKDRIIKSSIVLQMPEESIRRKKADMEQQRFLQDVLRKE